MTTEDLLKRAARTANWLQAGAEYAGSESSMRASCREAVGVIRDFSTALRESERQLALYRQEVVTASRDDLGRAGRIVELEAKLAESERHRAHLQDVVQGCAAAIAPLAEACGVRAIVECTEGAQCAEHGERVDALIGRVVAAAMAERRR